MTKHKVCHSERQRRISRFLTSFDMINGTFEMTQGKFEMMQEYIRNGTKERDSSSAVEEASSQSDTKSVISSVARNLINF